MNSIWIYLLYGTLIVAMKKEGKIAMAVKKDNTAKGVLTKDPFLDASHYWPLETSHSILTTDIVSGHNAILMGGAKIKDNQEFVTTEKRGSYIIAGDFKGTCFSNPDKCIMNGMTVSVWINMKKDAVNKKQDAYILSSGGQSKKSRGLAFLYFHGRYVYVVSTKTKQWKMYIDEIPTDQWVNLAFVWRNNEYLTYYLNGEKKQTVNATVASRPSIEYTILTISRPNNAVNTEFMYPLEMCCLALWDKPLKKQQIKSIYDSIKKLHDHPALKRRRSSVTNKKTFLSQKPSDIAL
jgi:hypothetical protein